MLKDTSQDKRQKTEIQKENDQKESLILWCQGSCALLRCLLLKFSSQSSEQCSLSRQVPGFLQVKLLSLSVVTCSKSDDTSAQAPISPQSIPTPFDTPVTAMACAGSSPLLVSSHLLTSQAGRQLTKSPPSFVCTSDLRGERGAEGEQLSCRVGHMSHLKSFNLDVRSLTDFCMPLVLFSIYLSICPRVGLTAIWCHAMMWPNPQCQRCTEISVQGGI